jgi:hypothetical protein
MVALERDRLARLGVSAQSGHGLIIPIVLRGARYLPEEIKGARHYYNFESFQLGNRRLSRHPRFAPTIREIAAYICDRYQELQTLPGEVFEEYEQFKLPEEAEIEPLLSLAGGFRMPFPRGDSSCPPAAQPARS